MRPPAGPAYDALVTDVARGAVFRIPRSSGHRRLAGSAAGSVSREAATSTAVWLPTGPSHSSASPPAASPTPLEASSASPPSALPTAAPASPIPNLIWSAPMSVREAQVATAFDRDGLYGLSSITGPWAVALLERVRGVGGVGTDADGVLDTSPAEIIVAHDPTGIMPLYWARLTDGGVAVSDHLPTLVLEPGVDPSIDPDRVALRYQGAGSNSGWLGMSMTDYRHIHAVPFGHAIAIAPDGTVRQVKFWDPAEVAGPDESMTAEVAAEALRAAIERAVARAMEAATEAGPAVGRDMQTPSGTADGPALATRFGQPADPAGTQGQLTGTRIGAEWGTTSPTALLAQRALVAAGDTSAPARASTAADQLACLLGADDTSAVAPELAAVPRAPLVTTRQMHEWTSALDYHRFPSRSRDSHVALAVEARAFGLTDIISGGHPSMLPLGSQGIVAGLLVRGRWASARALTSSESPTNGKWALKNAVRTVLRGAMPEAVVDLLRPVRNQIQQLGRAPHPGPAATPAAAEAARPGSQTAGPLAVSLRREQGDRYSGARSARDSLIATWMSGAHQRSWEGRWAYLGYFGIRSHEPFLDVEVVETSLRIPDSAWAHLNIPGWPYWAAVEPWIGADTAWRRSAPGVVWAQAKTGAGKRSSDPPGEPAAQGLASRTWRENDPAIAAILGGRPLSTGQIVDPCEWGI